MLSPRLRGFITWAGVFGLVVLLKRNALLLPASWDESWAVLPGGLWLAENNFNIAGLLNQPQWFQYGPGTYALAPITWMTGIVAALTTTTNSFLISLHLTHMAIGAVGLREVYRFARPVWSPTASAGLVIVTALVPVMNAQLGFMYLEIPIFTAGLLAVNAGLAGRWGRAAAWGALATSFKASGVLPLSAVAAAVLLSQRTLTAWRTAALTILPSVVVGLLPFLLEQPLATSDRDLGGVYQASVVQLVRMPELLVALVFAVLFSALPDHRAQSNSEEVKARKLTFAWLILGFIGFYAFTIWFVIPLYVLPRYFIMIVPFVFFTAWEVGRRRFGNGIPAVIGIGLVVSMVSTSSSSPVGDPSLLSSVVLESSNLYAPRLLVTQELLDSALATGLPVYVIMNTWFRTQYPDLGYIEQVPANIELVADLDVLHPLDQFVVVESLDDRITSDAIQFLSENQAFRVETVDFERDGIMGSYLIFSRAPE